MAETETLKTNQKKSEKYKLIEANQTKLNLFIFQLFDSSSALSLLVLAGGS